MDLLCIQSSNMEILYMNVQISLKSNIQVIARKNKNKTKPQNLGF